MPNETRLVDLSRLINAVSPTTETTHFALTASHDGRPGDLAISVFSTSQANDVVLTSPGILQSRATLDTSFWKIGASSAIPVVQNNNDVDASVRVMIHYMTAHGVESFRLPVMSVGSHKKLPFILQQAVLSGTFDELGNKIPAGIRSGLVTLEPVITTPEMASPNLLAAECESDCSTEQPASTAPFTSATANAQITGTTPVSGVVFANAAGCPPVISSIDPTSGAVGADPVITINGEDFATGQTVTVSGGITAEVQSVNDTGGENNGTIMTVALDIPVNVAAGTHTVTVNDELLGSSNSANFQVGDRTPSITSVSPSRWNAGTTVNAQIIGTGFGTDLPTLNISGGGVTGFQITGPNPPSDTEIDVSVTIDPNAPAGSATIEVTSNGYSGNPFSPVPGSSPNSPNFTEPVDPVAPGPVAIVFANNPAGCQGVNLATGQINNVVAGQQISLMACISGMKVGVNIASESWTPPAGYAVAAFTNGSGGQVDTTGGQVQQMQPAVCGTGTQCSVYWVCPNTGSTTCVYPGNDQVSFQYQLSNGTQKVSANAIFSVNGPTGTNVTTSMGTPVITLSTNDLELQNPSNPTDQDGIVFNVTGNTFPNGSGSSANYQWIQLLTAKSVSELKSNGHTATCTLPNTPHVLDTTYPYMDPSGPIVDSPLLFWHLGQLQESEAGESFSARMFLMWDPALRNDGVACKPANIDANDVMTPSSCDSIPIPIGYVDWHWSADAVNTLDTITPPTGANGWRIGGTGFPGCRNPNVAGNNPTFFHDAVTFPFWTGTQVNLGSFNCNEPIP
jgi:hypothetical protein